jgi:hypothetical protein
MPRRRARRMTDRDWETVGLVARSLVMVTMLVLILLKKEK